MIGLYSPLNIVGLRSSNKTIILKTAKAKTHLSKHSNRITIKRQHRRSFIKCLQGAYVRLYAKMEAYLPATRPRHAMLFQLRHTRIINLLESRA